MRKNQLLEISYPSVACSILLIGGCNAHSLMTQEGTINWRFCPRFGALLTLNKSLKFHEREELNQRAPFLASRFTSRPAWAANGAPSGSRAGAPYR